MRRGHRCAGPDCPVCDRLAEQRADPEPEVERPDAFGRDADWHFPRGPYYPRD